MTLRQLKANFWLIAAILTYFISLLFNQYPLLAERSYYKGVFQIIRVAYDYTLGWLPIPMFYIVLALTIYAIAQMLKRAGNIYKQYPLRSAAFKILMGTLNFLGFYYFMFYWLWGFNYQKPNFETTLQLDVQRISKEKLFEELTMVSDTLTSLRSSLQEAHDSIVELMPEDLESKIRGEMHAFLQSIDFPDKGRVRIRKLKPKGFLLRISTAGVYIPFAGEGHIDAGLHPITWPATMAHEMAHGYGFTDEGTCNFIGYHLCINSNDTYMQYSGWLMYFRYLYRNARRADREEFKLFQKELNKAVYQDLVDIDKYASRYPDILPKVRDAVYDQYLKTHGVKEGLLSYSRMILLVDAWNRKTNHSAFIEEN